MADKSLTLIAIGQIHRTLKLGEAGDKSKGIAPTPPKIQVIEPRTVFNALDQDEYDALTEGDNPAARAPNKDEKDLRESAANQITTEDAETGRGVAAAAKKANATKKAAADKEAADKKAAADKEAADKKAAADKEAADAKKTGKTSSDNNDLV